MISITAKQSENIESANALFSSNAFGDALRMASRIHDFTKYQCGVDYFFEVSSPNTKAYMTGQGGGIKPNDYIILQMESFPQRYQVEVIDYYAHPADMWIALLRATA